MRRKKEKTTDIECVACVSGNERLRHVSEKDIVFHTVVVERQDMESNKLTVDWRQDLSFVISLCDATAHTKTSTHNKPTHTVPLTLTTQQVRAAQWFISHNLFLSRRTLISSRHTIFRHRERVSLSGNVGERERDTERVNGKEIEREMESVVCAIFVQPAAVLSLLSAFLSLYLSRCRCEEGMYDVVSNTERRRPPQQVLLTQSEREFLERLSDECARWLAVSFPAERESTAVVPLTLWLQWVELHMNTHTHTHTHSHTHLIFT